MFSKISRIVAHFSLLIIFAGCGAAAAAVPTPTAPGLAEELIFYDWEDDMPQSVLEAFTEAYGVKVTYLTYESQEEAADGVRAGEAYDVVVFDNSLIPILVTEGLLAKINYHNVPNFKYISPNFRDLAYDPGNKYSVPFNWGTTGLVVRSDLVARPVARWADLWDRRYAGQVALWRGSPREVMGLTLKSLGYSVNSEDHGELEKALARLTELKQRAVFAEDLDPEQDSTAGFLAKGDVVLAMGWAGDALLGRELNQAIDYVLPLEGALLWGDNFVIPANSPNKYTAELFLNFLLKPEINARITNENYYATPNEAAYDFIEPEILNDLVVFPPNEAMKNAEIIMPLSPEGNKLHTEIWERFLTIGQ